MIAATDAPAPAPETPERSWSQRRLRATILWYQRLRDGQPSPCRFFPSCSSYALEAVEVHGTRRGGWLTLRRLARCRPLGPSGFDPVPPPAAIPTADASHDDAPTADASHDDAPTAPAPKGR